MSSHRCDQPPDHGQEEGPFTCGRFDGPERREGLVSPVTDKIQYELRDPRPGKDDPSGFLRRYQPWQAGLISIRCRAPGLRSILRAQIEKFLGCRHGLSASPWRPGLINVHAPTVITVLGIRR